MSNTMIVLAASVLIVSEPAADEQAIKRVVLEAQIAGIERHDLDVYMRQWSDDARIVIGRGPMPDAFDVVLTRKQIEDTRRIWFSDPPPADAKATIASTKCELQGERATLSVRLRSVYDQSVNDHQEVFRLRKEKTGWKVYELRYWSVRSEWMDVVVIFNKEHFAAQEERARKARMNGDLRDELNAYLFAVRFADAYRVAKEITKGRNVSTEDWTQRGRCALRVGNVDDAMTSFRRALLLDENADVPVLARTNFDKEKRK